MELSNHLRDILKDHLQLNKPRLTCFVELLLALLRTQHANLARLAVSMSGTAEVKSRYRRLQRFFSEVRFDYDAVARLIMQLFDFTNEPYYLALDRTQWQWRDKPLNVLTLAVVYKGTAIPVYWLVLNKKGNSNQCERIALLKRFIRQFGQQRIQGVLGDREFIGEQWWGWLTQQSIPFVMRMKENQHFTGEWKHRLMKPLRIKKHGRLEQSWFRYGLDYLADQLIASTPSGQESLRMLILFLWPPSWMVVKQNGGDIEIPWHRA